jgi:hypothetical protein
MARHRPRPNPFYSPARGLSRPRRRAGRALRAGSGHRPQAASNKAGSAPDWTHCRLRRNGDGADTLARVRASAADLPPPATPAAAADVVAPLRRGLRYGRRRRLLTLGLGHTLGRRGIGLGRWFLGGSCLGGSCFDGSRARGTARLATAAAAATSGLRLALAGDQHSRGHGDDDESDSTSSHQKFLRKQKTKHKLRIMLSGKQAVGGGRSLDQVVP